MTPLEAVARALANLRGCFGEVDDIWPDYETDARAALTALRDCGVTEGMAEAALSAQHGDNIEDFIKIGRAHV
jgi:hypothetical protein